MAHKNKYAIAIQAGAGPNDKYTRENKKKMELALEAAVKAAHGLLDNGGTAVDAVEWAVQYMEDNPLFNAGCGSSLNAEGDIEMSACIMEGKNLKAGAVSIIRNVKNPIVVARSVMEMTNHVIIGGESAKRFAELMKLEIRNDKYFITPHQYADYMESKLKNDRQSILKQRVYSTVGAVAVDSKGDIAAATSSGGTVFNMSGRIGDSGIPGAGCYANNKTCAVSATGDSEFLLRFSLANSIASAKQYTRQSVQQCVEYVINHLHKDSKADLGAIAIDTEGNIGIGFNSERMLRAWIGRDGELQVKVYE